MFLLTARLIAPLGVLTEKARALAAENFRDDEDTHLEEKIREDMPVHRTDEVGQLASSFAALGKALDGNIRRLKETVAVRQRMQGELNAARDIQMGILPPHDSAPKTGRYSAAAFLLPAKEVGGDLYDFFTAPDGRQVVVIGDVSDKGVSAALFMSMTVTLVRYAMAEGLSCAEAMRRINDRLAENNPSCMFVTLFIGLFDPESGVLDYASGAHCPPFVVSPDAAVPVRALTDVSGPLVGAMEGMDFQPCRAVIAPGEYCFIYTDGVSEAMDEEKRLFTEERIAAALDGLRHAGPEQVLDGIMERVREHRGTAEQSDDITMLCFKRSSSCLSAAKARRLCIRSPRAFVMPSFALEQGPVFDKDAPAFPALEACSRHGAGQKALMGRMVVGFGQSGGIAEAERGRGAHEDEARPSAVLVGKGADVEAKAEEELKAGGIARPDRSEGNVPAVLFAEAYAFLHELEGEAASPAVAAQEHGFHVPHTPQLFGGKAEVEAEVLAVVRGGVAQYVYPGQPARCVEGQQDMSGPDNDGFVELRPVGSEHIPAGQAFFHVLFKGHEGRDIFRAGGAERKGHHSAFSGRLSLPRQLRARKSTAHTRV